MGSCFSKKTTTSSSSPNALPDPPDQFNIHNTQAAEKKTEEETLKKEILIVKPRKSPDADHRSEQEKARVDQTVTASCASDVPSEAADPGNSSATSTNYEMNSGLLPSGGVVVRTSSCTKEEVDAILIQCGRLSRSASAGREAVAGSGGSCGRKYSGSKRSYDFDHEDRYKKKGDGIEEDNDFDDNVGGGGGGGDDERIHRRHRNRQRQSRPSSSPARRRTPSRERDRQQQQRSGSRERVSSSAGGGGGGRRVSRSPGRRFESPMSNASGSNNCGNNSSNNKPGKMVSVPATISSLAMDKSTNGGGGDAAPSASANKRIAGKRNASGDSATGCRSAASPRSRSPARANVVRAANENQQQQPLSLSRSNSRKADQSPYRRNPLGEIDQNCNGFEGPQKPSVENVKNSRTGSGKVTVDSKIGTLNCRAKDQKLQQTEEGLQQPRNSNVAVTVVVPSGGESLKPPQALTRSRSSRLSRELEITNPETLLNPSPPSSYTALLLEDIQNFHHKSAPAISLPPCVTKACSILEAVADLNSSTGRRSPTTTAEQLNSNNKGLDTTKDPFVESEVLGNNDLMEPSFHRYVTLRRGTVGVGGDDDMEEQESSGSNSFVGGGGAHQNWVSSSSSWEPNSADSTGRWTSSQSNGGREDGISPPGFERHDASEGPRRLGEKNHQQNGIGRGRVGSSRGLLRSMPTTTTLAAAAST